tara:strand:+ start:105 stop:563 length:459 start_codon:yes stop_codon:yes gene_type:complete
MASNFGFMKSGFNNLNEPVTNEMINNINALVFAFMEKAMISADIYVKHSGRNTITKKDIELGLKSETFKFLTRENLTNDIDKWLDILKEESSSEDDEEYEEIINEDYVEFTKSNCSCKICVFFNSVEDKWKEWEPCNQIEFILKNGVDKIST